MRPLPLVAATLVAIALSGCIVPESMTELREDLGYASFDEVPTLVEVKARATTLTPRVGQPVAFEAIVEGIAPSIVTITWDLGDAELEGPTITRAWDAPGEIDVVVTASAPTGESDSDRLHLDVRDNRAPTPVIVVEDREGLVEGEPAVLSASSSHDPDGDLLTFVWEIDGGAPIAGPAVERAFTAGVHRVRLAVSDGLDDVVASDAFGVSLPLAGASHVALLEEAVASFVFAVGDGASGLSVVLSHTTLAGLDDVDLVLLDATGNGIATASSEPSMLGSSSAETLTVGGESLSPGTYTLEARLVRGLSADVAIEGVLTYSPLSAAG